MMRVAFNANISMYFMLALYREVGQTHANSCTECNSVCFRIIITSCYQFQTGFHKGTLEHVGKLPAPAENHRSYHLV